MILKYASVAMLGVLGGFVLFGIITGMMRGFKRSLLRFVLYVGLLVAVFLLTPVVTNALLDIGVNIMGRTPRGWVNFAGDKLVDFLRDEFGNYVAPFGSYLTEFALGLVLAVVNMIIFFAMYFVLKFVSWIIYSIVAHFWAPKKDRHGKKYPKHVWGGLLVGALQGVALFLFFMLPVNGLLGVVHQAVEYRAENTQTVSVQSVQSDQENDKTNFEEVLSDVDQALGLYNNVLRYTGLKFLSDKAFEYQLTVPVEGAGSVNLVHDINSAWELYIDAKALKPVVDKIAEMCDTRDLTLLNTNDYELLRKVTNKVFDLEILKLADWLLADLDEILSTPFDEDNLTYLDGTQIYANSIYGTLVEQGTTERVVEAEVNNYQEFADSISAMVNFVADQKLNLIRNDILTVIDLFQGLNTYQIRFDGEIKTVAEVISQDNLDWRDYLNLVSARLVVTHGDATVGTPVLNVLGADLQKFSMVKMLGLPKVDNLIVYSNFLDSTLDGNESIQDLVYGMSKLFLGEHAFNHSGVQGNWNKLGDVLLDLADVINENSELVTDLTDLFNESEMDAQAMIGVIGKLIITQEYYDAHLSEFNGKAYDEVKYQKVDALLDGVYDAINAFKPVNEFLTTKLEDMNSDEDNELLNMLTDLMSAEREVWYDKFHGLVSAANLMNNKVVTDLMDKLGDGEGEISAEDIAQVFDVINNEMDGDMVTEIIDTVVNLPEVGATMKDSVTDALDKVDNDMLVEIFETTEDVNKAQDSLDTLKEYLKKENATEEDKANLATAMDNFLSLVDGDKFKDFIAGLNPEA